MRELYLACTDKEIELRQNLVHEQNKALIAAFDNLPFWKRWFREDDVREEILSNWRAFEIWMNRRIAEKRRNL